MKEQTAISRLRYHFMVHDDGRPTPYLDEAASMAIKALEKQIPKKPDIWGDGYADGQLVYDSYDCPNCGKTYELDYDDYDYCPKCGQKLDWSEV